MRARQGKWSSHKITQWPVRKLLTPKGFEKVTDINEIMRQMTKQRMDELSKLQRDYGTQSTDTLRDTLQKIQSIAKDFSELPAVIRDYFSNDELKYHYYLHENRKEKHAIRDLYEELTKSEVGKQAYIRYQTEQQQKAKEAEVSFNADVEKQRRIKKALESEADPKK